MIAWIKSTVYLNFNISYIYGACTCTYMMRSWMTMGRSWVSVNWLLMSEKTDIVVHLYLLVK